MHEWGGKKKQKIRGNTKEMGKRKTNMKNVSNSSIDALLWIWGGLFEAETKLNVNNNNKKNNEDEKKNHD